MAATLAALGFTMEDKAEMVALEREFSDKSRKVKRVGKRFLVPRKFGEDGEALTGETFDVRKHLRSLSLTDLRFLSVWRASGWNVSEAAVKANVTDEYAARLVKKLAWAKTEDARVKALAEIPTPDWISAKHTENVFEGRLSDSQRDSLKELAKITGAYKQQNIQIQQNVFNLPSLDPAQEAEVKRIFDAVATEQAA